MKTSPILTLLVTSLSLQVTSALAETCSSLNKESNTNAAVASKSLSNYSAAYKGALLPICSAYGISSECAQIDTLISKDLDDNKFMTGYIPLLKAALEELDDLRIRTTFNDLVMTLRNQHYNAKISKDNVAVITKMMATKKCGSILTFMNMTDVALVSESAKDNAGKCKVIAVKISGHTEYVLSVAGEDYPIKGVTYPSIPEVAKSLREALDAGSCL